MNRKLLTIGVGLIVVVGVLFIGTQLWLRHQVDQDIKNGASNQELLAVIVSKKPSFIYNHKPFIEVASVKRIDDIWYIVTIKSVHDDDMEVPVMVVVQDKRVGSEKRNLNIVLGPENHFSDYQLFKSGLPSSVTKEL